jgi:tryptophan synthase alpha chain
MTRIEALFDRLPAEGRAALITYITAGDPAPERTPSLVAALERGGADLIELGVPFSDPIADGPVIQRGSDRALRAGTTVKRVLDIAREIRRSSEIPLLLFSYLNPLLRYGFEALARDAKSAGIDGVLLIDLSVEEAEPHLNVLRKAGLDTVFLGAPTSTPERLQLVARYSTGFVYLVSRTGVTGERDQLGDAIAPLTTAMRRYTKLPLAVGFGIATGDQARQIAALADGVVVGSAVVRAVESGGDIESKLESLARGLSDGIRSAVKGAAHRS